MKHSTRTVLLSVILTAVFLVGVWGCGGSKVAGKAGVAEAVQAPVVKTLAEELTQIDAKIEILRGELAEAMSEVDVNLMVGAIERIADEAEAMVAAAERYPGVTEAEIDTIGQKVTEILNAIYKNRLEGLADDASDMLWGARKMAHDRMGDLWSRLADLWGAHWSDSVAILPGEDDGTWFAFEDEGSRLWGYRDKNGAVRIEPRFLRGGIGFVAPKFDHIVSIIEDNGVRSERYHLTKGGKILNKASDYRDRYQKECENEGFIRFWNRKKELAGMLDRFGNVVIPAEYNLLSRAQDGLVASFKHYTSEDVGGEYRHINDDIAGEEKGRRVGMVILDTLNNVLLEADMRDVHRLNLYSAVKTETPHPDTATRVSFPAKEGGYYSFICYEKEFRHWLRESLLVDLTPEKLAEAMLDSVNCFMRFVVHTQRLMPNWRSEKRELTGKVFDIMKNDLTALLNPERKHSIRIDGKVLERYSMKSPEFEKYYDNCGNQMDWAYPVFEIDISPGNLTDHRNSYVFLRTGDGYKLFGITIRNNGLFYTVINDAPARDFTTLGTWHYLRGHYDDAAALYGEALKRDSSNWVAYSNRSAVYYEQGEFARSIADAERSIRLDPSKVGVYNNRSLSYAALGDYKKTAADLDRDLDMAIKAITTDKKDCSCGLLAFHNYSVLHAFMGNEPKADSLREKGMALCGKNTRGYYITNINNYSRFITRFPQNALMHYHRGVIYARMGEYAAAAEDLKNALKLNPRHALAKKWLGTVDKKLKDAEQSQNKEE